MDVLPAYADLWAAILLILYNECLSFSDYFQADKHLDIGSSSFTLASLEERLCLCDILKLAFINSMIKYR